MLPVPCADPESFVRGGPSFFFFFFLVDEGRGSKYHYKRFHHWSTSEMSFRCFAGLPCNAGLVAWWLIRVSGPVLLRKPTFLLFFRGAQTHCPPPPWSAHELNPTYGHRSGGDVIWRISIWLPWWQSWIWISNALGQNFFISWFSGK